MENKEKSSANEYPLELNTMPGFAGSSAYYLRYEDPHNDKALVSKEANEYWGNVDLYVGGTEHATGHLIYSRFWNKFLYDLGTVAKDEPFQKLINQGMIQGRSNFVYRLQFQFGEKNRDKDFGIFISKGYYDKVMSLSYKDNDEFNTKFPQWYNEIFADEINNQQLKSHLENKGIDIRLYVEKISKKDDLPFRAIVYDFRVPINIVSNDILNIELFQNNEYFQFYKHDKWLLENGKYICGWAVEKMSKSYFNVVNPDDIVEKFGADTLRLYEMFLGPLEQSKPWDTNGIDGVSRFLRKLWNLFFTGDEFTVSDEQPTAGELKSIHKLIKKVGQDIENFSFNTSVAAFMICVNELTALKCNKRAILADFIVVLSPFAPHIAEELWHKLGNKTTVCDAKFPEYNEEYLKEDSVKYSVSFNGKVRFTMDFPVDTAKEEVEKNVLANENSQKWMEGKTLKKVIVVPGKIVNIVV